MTQSKAQIVATIGPSSSKESVLRSMIDSGLDIARLNFSWGNREERIEQISLIRKLTEEVGRTIPIIVDVPGPRIQKETAHTYDNMSVSSITDQDKEYIAFAVEYNIEYVALSFVGGKDDVLLAKEIVENNSKTQNKTKIIAKIERKVALENLSEIISVADAVMVARGDLGEEIPLEQVPFAQATIINACKKANKPVITATQMLLSMVENPIPTRAEVTDVANAILQGSDAVMLSEESAKGAYPLETVKIMEKIILEAEKHAGKVNTVNPL